MATNKSFFSVVLIFMIALTMFACNLEDFDLKKLAKGNDVIPEMFAPLGYGTFKVEDLLTITLPDTTQIPAITGMNLNPVSISKTGSAFRSAAIDSVYLITHVTNATPVDLEFELSFLNSSGVQLGQLFASGKIAAGAVDQRIQFNLGPTDQDAVNQSSEIKMSFKISSPVGANPILYRAVKRAMFTVKISFYAPVSLWKLSN